VKKIGDAPDKKETRRAPFVPPRTEDYSDSESFWTYRASEGRFAPALCWARFRLDGLTT
jgi:hypothetical protein